MILALRTDRGLPVAAAETFADAMRWAIERDLMTETHDATLVLTTRGRLLSNEVFALIL